MESACSGNRTSESDVVVDVIEVEVLECCKE